MLVRAKKGAESSSAAFAKVDTGINDNLRGKWTAAEAAALAGRDDIKKNQGMKIYQTEASKGNATISLATNRNAQPVIEPSIAEMRKKLQETGVSEQECESGGTIADWLCRGLAVEEQQ